MPKVAGFPTRESANRPPGRSEHGKVLGVCLFLSAAIWIVFGPTVHYDFVNFDDDVYVYRNADVMGGLTSKGVAWAFTHVHSSNWHPLTWLSHMLDCQVYGLDPGRHHLTNVILHAATAILLFLVLRQMTGALWRSAFVAAVFAIHPLRVESVAWIAERKDVLSGLFFMLIVGAYAYYVRHPSSLRRYGLVLLLFALGLMCKPMLVTLPLVLLLLDYWPLRRFAIGESRFAIRPFRLSLWPLLKEKIPLFLLVAASGAVTLFAQGEAMSTLPLSWRIGNALVSCVTYLGQMFYPAKLAVFYPHPENGLAAWKMISAFLLLLGISAIAVAARRKQPWLLVGWLWYLGMLVPAIGILQVGAQAHADRYTYLPQIGLYVLLAWAAANLSSGWRHRRLALGGGAAAVLMALILCARAQTSCWRNSESLWTHALACTPANITAHINLGNALLEHRNVDEAMVHYQRALQLKPDDADANVSFGYGLLQQGKPDEAFVHFQRALEIKPNDPRAHNDLGDVLAQKGNVDDAIAHFQKALQSKPDYAEACYNLGNAFCQKEELDEAIVYYRRALQINPGYAEACFNLGNTFFQKGAVDEAIVRYRQALQIRPDYAKAAYNLAMALLQKGNLDDAIPQFQKVLQLNPGQAEAHYHLGNALVHKRRVDEAIAQFQQALQLRPDYPEAQNNLAWELATAPEVSLRDAKRALELARQANQSAGGADPDVLGTLAAACAEAGRFEEAIAFAQKAIELARAAGQQDQALQLESQLRLYQAGLPFHQEAK